MSGQSNVFYKWGKGIDPDLPRIVDAEDEFLITESGTRIIDAAAGAAVVNLGHSLDVGDAFKQQSGQFGYISLSNFTARAPERLADQLAELTPGDLQRSFFVNSGSEAVESAIKLAHKYHHTTGAPEKSTVIARWQSYHGATLGALSASGNTGRRTRYKPLLKNWSKIPPAYPYRWSYDGSEKEQARTAAKELETAIRQEGPETVSAFLFEPVSGASIPGAHPHPVYFEEIQRICDEYDVLLIADEVMTGFGRTGQMFACERFDIVPDILVLGKGLSSGYAPISAAVIHESIADEFDSDAGGSFDHGHTYAGHPPSAAVARKVIDHYTEDTLQRAQQSGKLLYDGLEQLESHPMVGDIRRCGLMLGVEFVADKETKTPFDPELKVYDRVFKRALADGVYVYPGRGSVDGVAGDHCMLTPPLTTSEQSLDKITSVLTTTVDDVYEEIAEEVN